MYEVGTYYNLLQLKLMWKYCSKNMGGNHLIGNLMYSRMHKQIIKI